MTTTIYPDRRTQWHRDHCPGLDTCDDPTAHAAPELEPLPDTARMVVTFPLNGQPGSGYHVWIVDERTELERYAVTDHHQDTRPVRQFSNIADAIAYSLAGSGWGSYAIKERDE